MRKKGVLRDRQRGKRRHEQCWTFQLEKGTKATFPEKRMLAFLRPLGIVDKIEVQTIKEENPRASSGSKGVVERATQSAQGTLHVMKCALEARSRKGIPDEHPVLAWMPSC